MVSNHLLPQVRSVRSPQRLQACQLSCLASSASEHGVPTTGRSVPAGNPNFRRRATRGNGNDHRWRSGSVVVSTCLRQKTSVGANQSSKERLNIQNIWNHHPVVQAPSNHCSFCWFFRSREEVGLGAWVKRWGCTCNILRCCLEIVITIQNPWIGS